MEIKNVYDSAACEMKPEDTLENRIYFALPATINGKTKSVKIIPEGFVPVSDKLVGMPGSINVALLIQRGDTAENAHGEILAWDGEKAAPYDPKEAAYLKLECESRMKRVMEAEAAERMKASEQIERMAKSMAEKSMGVGNHGRSA